jgi:hypothetical protein
MHANNAEKQHVVYIVETISLDPDFVSSAVRFLLRVTLTEFIHKCKGEAVGVRGSLGGLGSKQAAHLHFMSASRISPLGGLNGNGLPVRGGRPVIQACGIAEECVDLCFFGLVIADFFEPLGIARW